MGLDKDDETSQLLDKTGEPPQLSMMESLKALFGIRLVALFFICFLTFGSYFTYDTPGALGYGVVCTITGDAKCYPSPSFNFLGNATAAHRYCPAKKAEKDQQEIIEGWQSCIIKKDEPMFKAMTADSCMADCWRSSPKHWKYYGTQVVDADNKFDVCFCANSLPDHHPKPVNDAYCNYRCNGADKSARKRPEQWHCGGLTHMTVAEYSCKPQTIEMHFRDSKKGLSYSNTENLTLYSVYSYPNAVQALLGGMLIDKLGLRSATLLFVTLILTGQIVFALGINWAIYPLMVVGRVIFGLGGESLTVAQSTYTARWFKRTGFMALAFGISLSFSRIGSSVGFMAMPFFAKADGVMTSVWLGAGACGVSWAMTLFMSMLDKYGEKRDMVDDIGSDEPFHLRDLKQFGVEMWLITGITIFYYIGIFPFNGIGKNFFNAKWHVDMVTAGTLVSVYTFTAAAGSPIIGLAVDRSGRALYFMFLGCIISVGCYIFMWIIPGVESAGPPAAAMVGVGISVTLLGASLWPAVPYIVDQKVLGSAYGMMTAVQNFGLAVTPQIIGVIRDKTEQQGVKSYYYCLYVLMFNGIVGCTCCIVLMIVNGRKSRVLLVGSAKREEIMKEKALAETNNTAVN
eukprot:TRINITY_DN68171_c8_g5_i2.p1 TRINITY_DN68171_c8_g5~~TRINITY_DN68171_c8_g5_i2.p1  ORF type:complete len:627 (-),score=58.27 TRINITY_DN68171_c8_g5_i2:1005-2885(-)